MVQTIGYCSFKNPEEFLGTLTQNGPGVQPIDVAIGGGIAPSIPTSPTTPTTPIKPVTQPNEPKPSSNKGYQQNFTIGTSAIKILDKNMNRVSALIRQTSSGSVYIGFDQSVSSSNGLLLNQNDSYEINRLNHYTGEIWIISSSTSQDVRLIEF